ncbi:MAG: hypothetical protein ACM3JB_18745 [Acidobacteriaceae bacterium]
MFCSRTVAASISRITGGGDAQPDRLRQAAGQVFIGQYESVLGVALKLHGKVCAVVGAHDLGLRASAQRGDLLYRFENYGRFSGG